MDTLPGWKVTLMLADSAQAVGGKLYILGGGWEFTGPQPTPMAIAVLLGVPWAETNTPHVLKLELLSGDGAPFMVPTPMGHQPFVIETSFEVGRPAGVAHGSSMSVPLALNLGPLPFTPGRYEWRCSVDGNSREDWRLPFEFRAV